MRFLDKNWQRNPRQIRNGPMPPAGQYPFPSQRFPLKAETFHAPFSLPFSSSSFNDTCWELVSPSPKRVWQATHALCVWGGGARPSLFLKQLRAYHLHFCGNPQVSVLGTSEGNSSGRAMSIFSSHREGANWLFCWWKRGGGGTL